ncbi:MAG: hypothetical protein IJW04_02430 [Ruminococcus sp.]|nr:hypothetical protein [Ruminococcus sp.]
MKKATAVISVILMLCCILTACSSEGKLIGKWTFSEDDIEMSFIFNEDGTGEVFALGGLLTIKFTYEVNKNTITFHEESQEILGSHPYTFTIKGDDLSLTAGGDVMVLTKEK